MSVVVLSIGVAVVSGALVNILAEILPQLSLREEDSDEESADLIGEAAPSSGGLVTRWNFRRYIVITIVLLPLLLLAFTRVPLPHQIAISFYLVVLMLISVIDIEHRLVLSIILIPSFVVALIEILVTRRIPIADALVGYAIAQIVVMLYYLMGILYLRIVNARRQDPVTEIAFGFGDVSLATFCGLIIGYPRVIYMLVLMALVGGILAFGYLVVRLVIVRRYEAHMAFPYGPAITIAAAIMLLWGERVTYFLLGGR